MLLTPNPQAIQLPEPPVLIETVEAEEIVELSVLTEREKIDVYIKEASKKYPKASEKLLHYIVTHESNYDNSAVGDTHLICPHTGKYMRARGLVQLTDCYFGHITDEQALDNEFAIYFLAKNIQEGNCKLWTTCRRYFNN